MANTIQVPVVQSGLGQSINNAVRQMGTINVPVNINPAGFQNLAQPLGKITGLATEFEKSIAASNARVLAFGASVGIINGVQNALSNLVKSGIEVQKTLAEIGAISGESGDRLKKLGNDIFDAAKNTGQSFKTASEAALEFSRQGLSAEETIKRTNDALTLSRFTNLSAAESVDTLTAALNTFKETGITSTEIINKLVAVDTKFAVSAEDLAKGISRAGSIAQEVGVNFDQLNAAITVAQEKTARGGAVIGNALKTIFTKIRSDEAVKALRDIGVESLNAQGELKGAIPLLQELSLKMKGLSGGERIQILEAVASKYNINILSSLLDDLNDANSKFGQAVKVSAGAGNEAYERLSILNKTLASDINRATESLTQFYSKLSEIGVTEGLGNMLKFVNGLLDSLNKLLDSEGVGGNIARGLIKGLSDIFFSVGLPIIAAIFVKLTKDIATFGVESLKTILGINQQVRERAALEQAVVNTLIKDQQIMANILAMGTDRTRQEQYLLSIYEAQIAAMQTVKNIGAGVAPGLMGAGLSAMSGTVTKRSAGGYLPAQEAADVRRGVGGANPNAGVVSIPNFAFGGGKFGTMVANTSEYVVPNFANGGSAIFNQDMVKAYGLPAGAQKISAADGYIPNFAASEKAEFVSQYAGIVPSRVAGPARLSGRAKDGKIYEFPMVYAGSKSESGGNIDEIRNMVVKTSKDLASKNARDYALAFNPSLSINPKGVEEKATQANQNKGAIESFVGSIFEASIAALLDDDHFRESQARSSISTFDFAVKPELKKIFEVPDGVQYLEAKNNAETSNLNKIADKISRVKGGAKEFANKRPTLENSNIAARYFNQGGKGYLEYQPGLFRQVDLSEYKLGPNQERPGLPKGGTITGASGYIPNFADPLSAAVHREMSAGLSPAQISITQDGRLRNAGNPSGLAVINSRDEPNGRIPNFAAGDITKRQAGRGWQYFIEEANGNRRSISNAEGQRLEAQSLFATSPASSSTSGSMSAASTGGSNDPLVTTNKLMLAFGGLTMITAQLQSNLKETNSGFAKFLTGLSQVGQSASGYGMMGGMLGEAAKARGGILGRMSGYMGPAGIAIGAGVGLYGAISENIEQGKQQRLSSAQEKLNFIEATSKSAQEAQDTFLGQYKSKAEAYVSLSEEGKALYNKRGGGTGEYAEGASQRELDIDKEKLQIQAELQVLSDNIQKKQAQINAENINNARQKAELEARVISDLRERVALSTKINEIEIAFAEGQNKSLIQRASARASEIVASANLSNSEKQQLELSQKITDIANERADVDNQILNKLLSELRASSELTSVDKKQVDSLIERVKNGEKITNLQKELNGLSEQGALHASRMVKDGERDATIQKGKLTTAIETTRTLGSANIILTAQVELQNTLLQGIKNKLELEKEYNAIVLQGKREIEDVQSKQQVFDIKQGIARTGLTPTRAQRAALTQAEFTYNLGQQTTGINRTFENTANAAFEKYKSGALAAFGGIQNIRPEDKTAIEKAISEATGPQGVQDAFNAGVKLLRQRSTASVSYGNRGSSIGGPTSLGSSANFVDFQKINELEAQGEGLLKNKNKALEDARKLREESVKQLEKQLSLEAQLVILAKERPGLAGSIRAVEGMKAEVESFPETFAYNTTNAFRDGLRDAMGAAISDSANLGQALQGVAQNFLKTMQNAFLQNASNNIMSTIMPMMGVKMATGGLVSGGSGYMDDVPAMLTGGEFVMSKSAVQKYGAGNLAKMNSGGVFLPGVRGGGDITGIDALRAFANQTTTSGATDIMRGTGSSAYLSLEDQSARLSRWALLNNDTIGGEIRSAQEQGLSAISQYDANRTQQRKAMQQAIVGTLLSAGVSYGTGALSTAMNGVKSSVVAGQTMMTPYRVRGAYGGMLAGYANGGPTDDTPAMLMSGEYVMSRGASRKYGTEFLNSMNSGRAPRFADGGAVDVTMADSAPSNKKANMNGDINISINVASNGSSDTKTQGDQTSAGTIDYKKMSERIKAVVLETIQEEKRLGGALRR